jgi:hypothetical protein
MDADAWLKKHATLALEPDAVAAVEAPLSLVAVFRTSRPLPEAYRGGLTLFFDDQPRADLGAVTAPAGERARVDVRFDLRKLETLKEHLTPGKHRARVRLVPAAPPFTLAIVSNEIEVEVPPEDGGGQGQGGGEPPPPKPQPEPPPPPPEPPPTQAEAPREGPPPPPPPPSGREEAVIPLVNEGATVKKDAAVVTVRDPDAGVKAPTPVPLSEVLRDFDRVVERAVAEERVPPADRELLWRYFKALRQLVAPETPPGR